MDLSSNQLTSFKNSGLTAVLQHNGTLTTLELQGNELSSGAPAEACLDDIGAFAQAVGTSDLRTLNITANCLGDAGLAAFFDALPRTGTTLRTLYLSVNTFQDAAKVNAAALSIARFLSDPGACRGLERLHLNGNHFGWQGVRTIVHAVIGSRCACTLGGASDVPHDIVDALPPNRSLLHLDLFSTGIDSLASPAPPDETHAFAWEHKSLLSLNNWPFLLQDQLQSNKRERIACQMAAVQVLAIARITGCRASDAGGVQPPFPFLHLPLELRGLILEYVGPALRHSQWTNVVRYACEPSTIGYGLRQVDFPTDGAPCEMVLPVPPWSWSECFAERSHPRNWYGETIDIERDESHDLYARGLSPDLLAFWECTGTDHA